MLLTFTGDTRNTLMTHQGGGVWAATWVPAGGPTHSVTATASALLGISGGLGLLVGNLDVTGTVTSNAAPRAASPNGVVNSASYQGAGQVAPGSWVSVFGDQLASAPVLGAAPYPTLLGDSQVMFGDSLLPLQYVSASQVNALVPFGLTPNTNQHLLIQRGTTVSVPFDVTVAEQQPGIYAADATGKGQGAIINAITGVLADPNVPVHVGDFISIYCSGLGAVNNPPANGAVAPSTPPLSTTVITPDVTIDGILATPVQYSGLAPGFVGLYHLTYAQIGHGFQFPSDPSYRPIDC
jgi:uncharacterized protein (TIGR03437 family)